LYAESQILDAFKSILALINHALDESIPVITHSPKRIPWWNPNLNWIRTRLNRAERRWHTNHENKDRLIASQTHATWNRAVHRAYFTYWQNKHEAMDQSTIWKTIRKHSTHTRSIPPLNGKVDFKQNCNELRRSLFPLRPKSVLEQIPHIAEPVQRLKDEISPITQRELSRTLDKVNLNSANGADGISYKVLRTVYEASPSILPRLFNAMLSHSIHPQEWKHAVCVVIPKKRKPSYKDPSAY
jgi:hypothetical protein